MREWLQLRARLRDERQFHLECAAAELRESGMSVREAKRAARVRFGGRRNLTLAARELGCDFAGLVSLVRLHRGLTSAWLQPMVLCFVIAVVFLLSASPREIAQGIVIRAHRVELPGAILLSVDGGITPKEFDALQSMSTITDVVRYQWSDVRGIAVAGATRDAVVSEARRRTGDARITGEFMQPHWELIASPAQSAWLLIGCYGAFLVFRYAIQFGASRRRLRRWMIYGAGIAALHATASLAVWTAFLQRWNQPRFTFASGLVFSITFGLYLGVAAMQCRFWWIDLRARCPVCFERMILPLTEGAAGSMILRPAVTESVCSHGHGVLVEGRWHHAFRSEESLLESLVADV